MKAKASLAAIFGRSGARRTDGSAFVSSSQRAMSDGSGVRSSRPLRAHLVLILILVLALSALAVFAAGASADTEFGEEGQASGILTSPEGIAVDQSNGDLYVGGGFAHRVAKFEGDGTPLLAWGYGIVDGKEELETCTTNCLAGYETPFEAHSVFGPMIDDGGAVAVDPTGEHDVYLVDDGHSRILKFKPNGEFLFAFGGDTVAYGPDNSNNNGVQVLKILATGGTYSLRFEYPFARAYNGGVGGGETGSLPANATATEIETALNGLSTVNGAGVSGGHIAVAETGTREFKLTFEGHLGGDFVPAVQPSYGNPPVEPTLTGGEERAEVVVTNAGGAAEVCKNSSGDTCKYGGLGTENGMFRNGEHYEGRFFSSFPNRAPTIAVGSTGTVYVGDNQRIQEFNPEGQYIGQINLPTPPEHWNFTKAIALDSSGNLFVISEIISQKEELEHPGSYKREITGVQEFNSSGTLVRTLEKAPLGKPVKPETIAIDENNDIFVGEQVNNPGEPTFTYEFAGYRPNGTHYAQFGSSLIKSSCEEYDVPGAAIGLSTSKLYVTNSAYCGSPAHHVVVIDLAEVAEPGPPIVEEEKATNIEPTTTGLHAAVNPKGSDTHYHFEYVDKASFESEGGFSSPHTKKTASTDLGLVIEKNSVQAAISALKPGTVYEWRAVAESAEGTIAGNTETFETLTPVSVREFTTQTVTPELVTLKAELNPNGQASNFKIRIGENTSYGTGTSEGTLEAGNEFVKEEFTFSHLKPNTTYHYQLIAENAYDAQYGGAYETTDQTFTTELSSAEERASEDCPNGSDHGTSVSTLREENFSLKLPDCRAYEQATPTEKAGGEAFPYVGFSPNGERVLWYSEGAFAGAAGNQLFIPYLSQRSESGWTTQALVRRPVPPPIEPVLSGLQFTPEMDRWLFYESNGLNAEEGAYEQSSVFLSEGLASGSTVTNATPQISLIEGPPTEVYQFAWIAAASNDFSRIYLITGRKLLASDPRPDDGDANQGRGSHIYEVSGVGGSSPTMKLVADLPLGLTLGGSFGAGACEIDNENTFDLREPRMVSTSGANLFYTGPVEDEAGKPCGEGTPNPLAIFARTAAPNQTGSTVDLTAPFQCTGGHPCSTARTMTPRYLAAAEDGSRVWFMTEQPLVNSDNDTIANGKTGRDMYVAEIDPATGQLMNVVQASAGESTPSHPNPGENADVGETGVTEEGGDKSTGAVQVSADGSHAAFESPAVLTTEPNSVGDAAINGANNLYVYDAETKKVKFVTKLCSGPEETGTNWSKATNHSVHGAQVGVTSLKDEQCPSTISNGVQTFADTVENDDRLWFEGGGPARMTPNGKFMVFLSYGRLTPDDTDNVQDLYRYDFETGELKRVSIGHDGNDGNGNDNEFPVSGFNENGGFAGNPLSENGGRNISADGSRVVFETAAPLVGHDENTGPEPGNCGGVEGTGCDIYEWEEQGTGTCNEAGGCVDLISDGQAYHGSAHGVISSSGRDIVFGTARELNDDDSNGTGDIYDARVDGGFHPAHPKPACPNAELCRPEREHEPPAPKFGTQEFVGPGNSEEHLKCAKGKVRVIKHGQVRCVRKHKKSKHHKRSHDRMGADHGGAK